MISYLRQWKAQRKLAKLLRKRLTSFEHYDYLKRRDAALRWRASM